jgi:peptidyl-prolyl cis-trans isomerase A (cyclophilin A)
MPFKIALATLIVGFTATAYSAESAAKAWEKTPGLYAIFDTNMGKIVCSLFEKESPIGVANFVGLAQGTKEFKDMKTGKMLKKPFYDGLIFHRVIPNFMIQGGCPLGIGIGGPGYQFVNEDYPGLSFDRPGRLAYANAGKDTNGSQFFITEVAYPSLNHGYTIFGQTVEGQELIGKIARVQCGPNDKPINPVIMTKVTIMRVGPAPKLTPVDKKDMPAK